VNDPYVLPVQMSCFGEIWKQGFYSIYTTSFVGVFLVDRRRTEAAVLGRFKTFEEAFQYLTGQRWPEPLEEES
jgi:hypothetical protein